MTEITRPPIVVNLAHQALPYDLFEAFTVVQTDEHCDLRSLLCPANKADVITNGVSGRMTKLFHFGGMFCYASCTIQYVHYLYSHTRISDIDYIIYDCLNQHVFPPKNVRFISQLAVVSNNWVYLLMQNYDDDDADTGNELQKFTAHNAKSYYKCRMTVYANYVRFGRAFAYKIRRSTHLFKISEKIKIIPHHRIIYAPYMQFSWDDYVQKEPDKSVLMFYNKLTFKA